MDKRGGLIGNVIILVAVFLVGTFFGFGILAKIFDLSAEEVAKLGPDDSIPRDVLVQKCQEPEVKREVCYGTGRDGGGIGVEGFAVGVQNLNESNSSG